MRNARSWALGFDADDTLWHNERFFKLSQERFAQLLSDHADPGVLDQTLQATERRNLQHYGFGIKGFTLSMIETALQVTDNRVPQAVLREIVDMGRDMLSHPLELLPGAGETVAQLAQDHHLILITKGDLLHQEQKLAASGLGDLFDGIEIVSDKTVATYQRIYADHTGPGMMVGNSLKSDVIPALDAGLTGVHVPHELEWDFEAAEAPTNHPRFHSIPDLGALPQLLESLA